MKLFISYTRLDRRRVDDLVLLFRQAGHFVWYDYNLLPGQTWQQVIKNQIKDCDIFVATLSAQALASEWCQWELNLAFASEKQILPIALSTDITVPNKLTALHVANYGDLSSTSDLNRILGSLAQFNSELSGSFSPDISLIPKGRPSRDKWIEKHTQNSAHMHLSNTSIRMERNQTPNINHLNSIACDDSFGGFIGIDFGTSSSVCAVLVENQLVVIPNRFGNTSTPSAVYIHDDGNFSVGETAVQAALRDPKHAVLQVKRLFGTDVIFRAYGKEYTAPELAAEIIKILVKDCDSYLGASCRDAVVTAPAHFTESQLDDLRIAYQLAGIKIKRLIVEPTAACMSSRHFLEKEGMMAVFDIGGGTFDVSIVEVSHVENEIQIEVLSISGNDKLGGSDYDQEIVDYCISCFMDQTGIDLTNNLIAQMRLRDAAEFAKIQLTSSKNTVIHVPTIYADASGSYDLTVPFTTGDFENLTEHLTCKIMDCCKEAMAHIPDYYEEKNILSLLLVGQASRTPLIRKQAEDFFKCKANPKVSPDKAVALGAAMQGAVLTGTIKDMLLLDVISHDLGITILDGNTKILIKKNTTIPTMASEVFTTTKNKQTHAIINIIQCTDESEKNNLLLSRLVFSDITARPSGEAFIEIIFSLYADSELVVEIVDKESFVNKIFSLHVPIFHPLPNDNVVTGELVGVKKSERE